jgi:hypothetical protein
LANNYRFLANNSFRSHSSDFSSSTCLVIADGGWTPNNSGQRSAGGTLQSIDRPDDRSGYVSSHRPRTEMFVSWSRFQQLSNSSATFNPRIANADFRDFSEDISKRPVVLINHLLRAQCLRAPSLLKLKTLQRRGDPLLLGGGTKKFRKRDERFNLVILARHSCHRQRRAEVIGTTLPVTLGLAQKSAHASMSLRRFSKRSPRL